MVGFACGDKGDVEPGTGGDGLVVPKAVVVLSVGSAVDSDGGWEGR